MPEYKYSLGDQLAAELDYSFEQRLWESGIRILFPSIMTLNWALGTF
jgi:hypothetical protein